MKPEYTFVDTSPVEELMPYRDIAKELQCSPMEVMRIEHKALKKIRNLLVQDPRIEEYGRPNWLPSIHT
jgi:hypothetical protein